MKTWELTQIVNLQIGLESVGTPTNRKFQLDLESVGTTTL
ncbi:hypothetical protein LEP1GSC173_1135 [Leptospira interrogans str. HAI1594]|nr:hypothetical protein LEP1GSC173_1135 [Leptospira interrogans str. HAI1594]